MASVTSICIGLLFGFILLLLLNPRNALPGMGSLLGKGFTDVGNVLYRAAPLVMVGLAVAFAYQVGLFNIGASGQYTIGAFLALTCAIELQMPWYVCLLAALGGAIWGLFPGLFKAFFNVNEVLTAIMFNWIGMNLVNFLIPNMPRMLDSDWGASASDRTAALANANPGAILPRLGLDRLFHYSYMNIGIILAIVVSIVMWVILKKTTFGYELKALRQQPGRRYVRRHQREKERCPVHGHLRRPGRFWRRPVLPGRRRAYTLLQAIETAGFDGISVALLANCNPIGCIFSAMFLSYLRLGGNAMQSQGYATEATDIVISVIVYLAAFALLIRMFLSGKLGRRRNKNEKKEAAAK